MRGAIATPPLKAPPTPAARPVAGGRGVAIGMACVARATAAATVRLLLLLFHNLLMLIYSSHNLDLVIKSIFFWHKQRNLYSSQTVLVGICWLPSSDHAVVVVVV